VTFVLLILLVDENITASYRYQVECTKNVTDLTYVRRSNEH